MSKWLFCGILIMTFNVTKAIPAYEYKNEDLLVGCPAIDFDRINHLIKQEVEELDPIIKDACESGLVDAFVSLDKKSDLNSEELILVSCNLCSISDFLSTEIRNQLMNACLNLLIRAALKGNINAMYDLVSTSFIPDQSDIKSIIYVTGVDNLDYAQLVSELSQKLEEAESENTFVEVIKNIKSNSAMNSSAASSCLVHTSRNVF